MKKHGATSDVRLKRIFRIHQVLRNSRRGWSAKELCAECREIDATLDPEVDARTIMNDVKFLRDVLHAPLPERTNKHDGYYYQHGSYSILEGLDNSYLGGLNEALALLRQLAKAKEFMGLEDLLLRLEQRVTLTDAESNSGLQFETVELSGREHLIGLYRAIQKQAYLRITYQTFQGETPMLRHVFPLLLKEYNNRWVLIAWELNKPAPQNLPIDRIKAFHETAEQFTHSKSFDSTTHFQDVIGTTATGQPPETIVLRFSKDRANYVLTKKIHPKQTETWLSDGQLEVRLWVELNRELEARILEFGRDVMVINPPLLRKQIRENLEQALANYY